MARTLPWLKAASKPTSGRTRSPTRPDAATKDKRTRVEHIPASVEVTAQDPPSSPPARGEPHTPPIEYMREGFDADDKFRMVEDELYSTALIYTRHLHEDAYNEHNKRALARAQAAISNPKRAANGQIPSQNAVVDVNTNKRDRKGKQMQEEVISDDSATASEAESSTRTKVRSNPFAGFKALESQPFVDLNAAVGKRPNTLAAAGYNKATSSSIKVVRPPISTLRAHGDDSNDTARDTLAKAQPQSITKTSEQPMSKIAGDSFMTAYDRSATSAFLAKRKATIEEKQRLLKRGV